MGKRGGTINYGKIANGDIEKQEERIKLMERYLASLGFDTKDPDLKETPRRIVQMHEELLSSSMLGHNEFSHKITEIMKTEFPLNNDNMVVINDIETTSICPHHFAPIRLNVSVVYIPDNGRVVGLSKIPRLIDFLSKRPIMQEELTEDIAKTIEGTIKTKGVMVVVKGIHSCMTDRGVKTRGYATTSAIKGVFRSVESARIEALRLME